MHTSRFEVDSSNCLRVAVAGIVTIADIRDHLAREREDEALSYVELFDAREAKFNLSSSDVRQISSLLTHLGETERLGPTAVVVSDEVGFGMIRMLQMLMEPAYTIRPFRDADQAEEWIREILATWKTDKQEGKGA